MIGRGYMEEVLIQVIGEQSECIKREFEKNTARVHVSSCKPTKKVCDENETNKEEKNDAHIKM